jgi:hypothetical protein
MSWRGSRIDRRQQEVHLILRSTPKACVSKDGQQAGYSFPPFETHRYAMLLRVRFAGSTNSEWAPVDSGRWLAETSAFYVSGG